MIPMTGDPVGATVRWLLIHAWDPYIALAIPAVVPLMPSPIGMLVRWRGYHFDDGSRRTDSNHPLRLSCAGCEKRSNSRNEDLFFHEIHLLVDDLDRRSGRRKSCILRDFR